MSSKNYRMLSCKSIATLEASQWDSLLHPAAAGAVFCCHAWLEALEASGCVGPDTGWTPAHLLACEPDGKLVAAAPRYLKTHSYGEYVFDWAWADAFERHGLHYYPKWLVAIPFTPVEGPRLLAGTPAARAALCSALQTEAAASGLSSLHVLFADSADNVSLAENAFLTRYGVQFRWTNRGYADFDAFLASLAQPKRKKIRAERRRVAAAGIRCERLMGKEIHPEHWRFFYACYRRTYREHHSFPYLNLEFFERIGSSMPQACVLVLAYAGDRAIAASLLIRDSRRLYGRYWGAIEEVDCLHFELAYYQSIEAAIALDIEHVEGGAQGEHKLARGFLPVRTQSCHWIAEPAFAAAIEDFLRRERQAVEAYLRELSERSPYRGAAAR